MSKTLAAILAEISSQMPDNTTGLITPAIQRSVLTDITSSGRTFINVMDYGATGNGVTDDGPAFSTALSALSSTGGTLFVPPGTYILNTYAINPPNNTVVQGAGIDNTILKSTGSFPNNVTIQIPFTLTGTPWPTGPTTYPINAPTLGGTTITTTNAADAGNFAAGNIIFITGDTHGTSFWYPGWYTTVVSVNAGTGLITLAETLPISVGLTRCQKIVNLPQNITVRDLTVVSGSTAAIECQGGLGFLFENIKVIPGSGGVSTADVTFGIHKHTTVRNMRMEQGANPLELFVSNRCTVDGCSLFNSYILVDGGCFDCSVINSNVKDPQNNGASFHGIHLPEYALRNRIIGNSVTGIPNGFGGINVSASVDSNRNHLIIGNTLIGATGSGGSATGINTSDGIVVGNFFSNLGNAIQLQSTESPIIEGNYFDLASPNGNNVNPFSGASFFRSVAEGNIRAMTSGAATPQVAGNTSYTLGQSGAFSVTNFTGARPGDKIWVATTDANTTFVSGSGITMKGGINYNAPNNTVLQFMALTGTTWIEVSRTQ